MPHLLPRRRIAAGTAVLAAASLAAGITMVEGSSASATLPTERTVAKAGVHKVKVDRHMFGVHDAHLHSLSRAGTGSIRLWDTGVSWSQLQPADAPIDFSSAAAQRLTMIVNLAWKHHTEVTYVVGKTPTWASDGSSTYVDGTEPPTQTAYKSFLGALMKHYKNWKGSGKPGIANYQVWNEANIQTFWHGTQQQMADLVMSASRARASSDPKVKLLGPAQVENQFYMRSWTQGFYKKSATGGMKVWKYLNAISLQLYPQEKGKPEDSMALYRKVRKILTGDGVPRTFPVWDTEINYGLVFGGNAPAATISNAKQVSYVMRTYLLSAAAGIKRVFWYSYDMGLLPGGGTLGNTRLTNPTDPAAGTLTAAGHAFTRIQSWMRGTLVGTTTKQPCIRDRHGTYTCTVQYAKGVGRIYWNPKSKVQVRVVRSATRKINEFGNSSRIRGGSTIKVNYQPVLVKSTR